MCTRLLPPFLRGEGWEGGLPRAYARLGSVPDAPGSEVAAPGQHPRRTGKRSSRAWAASQMHREARHVGLGSVPGAPGSEVGASGSETRAPGKQPDASGSETRAPGKQPDASGCETRASGEQPGASGSELPERPSRPGRVTQARRAGREARRAAPSHLHALVAADPAALLVSCADDEVAHGAPLDVMSRQRVDRSSQDHAAAQAHGIVQLPGHGRPSPPVWGSRRQSDHFPPSQAPGPARGMQRPSSAPGRTFHGCRTTVGTPDGPSTS
jgi:hypothetical protein